MQDGALALGSQARSLPTPMALHPSWDPNIRPSLGLPGPPPASLTQAHLGALHPLPAIPQSWAGKGG